MEFAFSVTIVSIVLLSIPSNTASGSLCDHPFRQTAGGQCLFLSRGIATGSWAEAQEICGWLNPGGRLAEFLTIEQIQDAKEFLVNDDPHCEVWPAPGPWIGATEIADTNQFVWFTSNTSVVLGDWIQGQPNSASSEDGVAMACEFGYLWMDKQRDTDLPFLCQMTPKATCPSEFTPIGDSCYYFGTSTMPWDTAQEVCRTLAPNGKLVEMETAEELYELTNFLMDFDFPSSVYWIGAQEQGYSGHYRWASSGKPVISTNWNVNYTASDGRENDVVGIFRSADWHWNDAPKSNTYFELCEADPTDLTKQQRKVNSE